MLHHGGNLNRFKSFPQDHSGSGDSLKAFGGSKQKILLTGN